MKWKGFEHTKKHIYCMDSARSHWAWTTYENGMARWKRCRIKASYTGTRRYELSLNLATLSSSAIAHIPPKGMVMKAAKACVPCQNGSRLRHSPFRDNLNGAPRTNVSSAATTRSTMMLLLCAIGPIVDCYRSANSVISDCNILVDFLCLLHSIVAPR
jgi:hypothetical protein